MPRNPSPHTALADIVDQLEEELGPQDERLSLIRELQDRTSKYDLWRKAAHSLETNGPTRHTRSLFRQLGYELRRIA